ERASMFGTRTGHLERGAARFSGEHYHETVFAKTERFDRPSPGKTFPDGERANLPNHRWRGRRRYHRSRWRHHNGRRRIGSHLNPWIIHRRRIAAPQPPAWNHLVADEWPCITHEIHDVARSPWVTRDRGFEIREDLDLTHQLRCWQAADGCRL